MRKSLFSIRWFQQGLTCLSLSLCFHTVAVAGLSMVILHARKNVSGESIVIELSASDQPEQPAPTFYTVALPQPSVVEETPVETPTVEPSTPTIVRKPVAQPEPSPTENTTETLEPKVALEVQPVKVAKRAPAETESRASLADFAAAISRQPRAAHESLGQGSPVSIEALGIPDTPRESVVFRRKERLREVQPLPEDETPIVPQAEFFGVQATGKKFAFVVDCSISMSGVKWGRARTELLRSLEALADDQQFFVVFFDGGMHRMPRMDGVNRLEGFTTSETMPDATEENLATLKNWMRRVGLGRNTRPYSSVREAFRQQPDAIFFLSDGAFADQTLQYLRDENQTSDGVKIPVHAISFQAGSGAVLLKRMAEENGGKFQMAWR